MKKAFTLAEVLITLGIIGVIAALIVPAISNVKPDKNKTAYLQVYDTISSTVNSLAHNSKIYPTCNNPNVEDNVNCSQYPLLNTSRPLDERYNNAIYQGDRKLCSLMALSLGVAEDDIGCSNTTYAFNAADYTDGFANESFVTKNGMRWRIVPQIATYTNNFEARFQNDIYVDIDPTNNNIDGRDRSCIFDEENCTQPDIFKFLVSADGKVIPADPMGRLYISGRKSLVRKDLEEDAFDEDNVITANLPTSDRVFLYSKCNGEGGSPCAENETMEITDAGITCTASGGGGGGESGNTESVVITIMPCYFEGCIKCPTNVQATSGLTFLGIRRTFGAGTVGSRLPLNGETILEGTHDFITITGTFNSGVSVVCSAVNNTCITSERHGDTTYNIQLINNSNGTY